MLERLRTWLGAKVVALGVRIVGFDSAKVDEFFPEEPEDDESNFADTTCPPVELNARARAMVEEGLATKSIFRPPLPERERERALAGSVRDQIEQARKQHFDAQRPRK